jgi:hypothetical protein
VRGVGEDEKWEVVEEEEEVVGEEEEVVGEEEEVVGEDEEVVGKEEEVVVAGPRVADPVYAYILGVVSEPPEKLGEWKFRDLLVELRKAEALGYGDRVRRLHRLIWLFCPVRPNRCPFLSYTAECPFHMEKSCRAFFFLKPKRKARAWFRE